jgi:hypothetical protein
MRADIHDGQGARNAPCNGPNTDARDQLLQINIPACNARPVHTEVPNVWPGRAVQDGLPRSTNVRAASMYQASEVEHLLRAIMGIRAHPGLATG